MIFQHTAARRGLGKSVAPVSSPVEFQHTAARRRLGKPLYEAAYNKLFQHTAARRRLGCYFSRHKRLCVVSTHSRPKAAGFSLGVGFSAIGGFNTQPPEGGWDLSYPITNPNTGVSTHSRPKAAGVVNEGILSCK